MITKKINKVKNLKNEKWLNWKQNYYVSNKGRAKKVDQNGNEILLKPSERDKKNNHHLFLNLKSAGLGQPYIHRIVFEAFVRPLKKNEVINHRDENPLNNNLENLEVMTVGEHSRMHRTGKTHSEQTKKKISESLKKRHSIK